MAASTQAFFLFNPKGVGPDGRMMAVQALAPEEQPAILWGQGTPAAIEPFTLVNKGSLYLCVNNADDVSAVYQKVDEGLDSADWVELIGDGGWGGSVPIVVRSALFDISASDSEQVIFTNNLGVTLNINSAVLIWNEATAASGAAEGDITIGTTTGGAGIVAATAYGVSQATGAVTSLTLAATTLAANAEIFASHDVAAGAAGTYYLQMVLSLPG